MAREVESPATNERGDEVHPAFGKVTVRRDQVTPGASLFDSEIRHREVVTLSISSATRKRDLNRDWIHSDGASIIEIEMSLAQWASVVSSFGQGDGTPVTIRYNRAAGDDGYVVPEIPFEPRMATQVSETVETATRVYDRVRVALAAYKAHKTAKNLRDLELAVEAVKPNVKYATDRLTEHVEETVTRAKADVEAMVLTRAQQLGLNPADVAPLEIL